MKKIKVNGQIYTGKEFGMVSTELSSYDFPDGLFEKYSDGDAFRIFEVEEDVFDENDEFVETKLKYILSHCGGFNQLFGSKEEMFEEMQACFV